MNETEYRQSRICRLLGNPVIYQLVVLLEQGGAMTPSALAKLAGRSGADDQWASGKGSDC